MDKDFQLLTHQGIRTLVPYKPGKSIEELAREKGLTDIIKLASNENPLGCSPLALKAIRNMSSNTLATYPSPLNHHLMSKLSEKLGVTQEQLFLSNGSDFICSLLMNCFVLHQDRHIMTHEYAFSTYEIQANSLNIFTKIVPVSLDWQVDVDAFIHQCTEQTALIFIANPNNPTGLLMPQSEIKRLVENIPKTTLLVLDEAYYEFAATRMSCNSIDWLGEHPNLVIMRTFSKIYGLAGLRLGYALAHPSVISLLRRLQLPFTVNQVALAAGEAALSDDEFIARSLECNRLGMQQIATGLTEIGLEYLPSACNFFTVNCKDNSMALYEYLLNQGIIVRPLHAYKMNNYIRVTAGTHSQNERFLQALNAYYA